MRNLVRACLGVLVLGLTVAGPAGATVYLSPNGSDAAACTQAAPCQSFSRGFAVAPAGTDVEVAGGSYGSQTLRNGPAKGSPVTIHPAAGAPVTLGSLSIENTSNVEVQSVDTNGWSIMSGSQHVVLRNVRATDVSGGAAAYFSGADDVQILGGEIGRVDPEDAIHFNNGYGTNTNITIDGLFVHDLTRNSDPSAHDDCVQTGDVTNLTIRNSRFFNCGTQGIFLNPYNGGATRNIVLEDNWFGPAQLGYNTVYVGEAQNVTIRNNSFTGSMYVDPATSSGVTMVNNILDLDSYTCGTTAKAVDTFDYNMSESSCSGATHHVVKPGLQSQFVNAHPSSASAFDLHLNAGAAAIDRGSPSSYAPTDIDGQPRPIGGAPDIGADEWGATPPAAAPAAPVPATPSGGSTPPSSRSAKTTAGAAATAAAVAAIAKVLPGATAAAFRRLAVVRQATKRPLVAAGVKDAKICKYQRKSCPRSTLLRIAATGRFKAMLTVRRGLAGDKVKTVRRRRLVLRRGTTSVRVRVGRLAKGDYELLLRAPNGARVAVPLSVG